MRLIDADAIQYTYTIARDNEDGHNWQVLVAGKDEIDDMPTIEDVPVKHGRWLQLNMPRDMENYKCSFCRDDCYVPECMGEPMYEYCPNCGARMDGGKDG